MLGSGKLPECSVQEMGLPLGCNRVVSIETSSVAGDKAETLPPPADSTIHPGVALAVNVNGVAEEVSIRRDCVAPVVITPSTPRKLNCRGVTVRLVETPSSRNCSNTG